MIIRSLEISGGNEVDMTTHAKTAGFYGIGTNFMSSPDILDLLWNRMPKGVVDSPSGGIFKTCLGAVPSN